MFRSSQKIIALYICVLMAFFSTAQKSKLDSLLLLLKNTKHDTVKLNLLVQLSEEAEGEEMLKYTKPAIELADKLIADLPLKSEQQKKAILKQKAMAINNTGYVIQYNDDMAPAEKLFFQALEIQNAIGDHEGAAHSYNNLGVLNDTRGNTNLALEYYLKSLKAQEKYAGKQAIAISLSNIGVIFNDQGDIPKALEYFYKSLKMNEDAGNLDGIAASLLKIGTVNSQLGYDSVALEYYKKSLKIMEKNSNKSGLAVVYSSMAMSYKDLKKYSLAFEYGHKSVKLLGELDKKRELIVALNYLASIYETTGDINKALEYCEKSLNLSRHLDVKGQGFSCGKIAFLYFQMGSKEMQKNKKQRYYQIAALYGDSSFVIAKELGHVDYLMTASQVLNKIYKALGNYKIALEMSELSLKMNDSITNEASKKAAYKTELRYDFEKKALADSLKAMDEKKVASAKLAESIAKLKQEKTQRFALIGGIVLMLGFAVVIYNRFKNSQKQKRVIEEQKLIVDESQKKIISSINYAKKIQYSILPSNEEIAAFFPQHFVMFKPKDIVSGDFYWFHHENDLSFFAVADCTGHGVPGAFMTMIAHSILIEVVVEQKIISPDKILSHLHQLIFKNLQQQKGDEYSQDGMDISLGVIDHKNNLLHFSAARNSAFLIDNKEIRILKATAKSIGGLSLLGEVEPERDFKSETVEIKKDTLLIFSTDGIFDQLNEQDEKFGTNRFKEMILNLNSDNSVENLQILETNFKNWKGSAEQLDDVLLAGIRF